MSIILGKLASSIILPPPPYSPTHTHTFKTFSQYPLYFTLQCIQQVGGSEVGLLVGGGSGVRTSEYKQTSHPVNNNTP